MSILQEPMMLWLPSWMVEEVPEAVKNITKANGLVMDYLDRDIPIEQMLDEFNDIGVDLDDYADNLEATLRRLGA